MANYQLLKNQKFTLNLKDFVRRKKMKTLSIHVLCIQLKY